MVKENRWEYEPDEDEPATGSARKGSDSYSWTASEYIDHKQGTGWFAALAAITILLAALIYLLTKDIFGTSIIIALGLIVGIFARRSPREMTYELTAGGLIIGGKLYPYRQFKSFAIIPDGALLSLDLDPIKKFMPPVSIYFDPVDHEKIFSVLEHHLPYQEKNLDLTERLTRRLRF